MSTSRAPASYRLSGLDGVRALAVTLVLLYHSELPGLAPAGFLGVDVFFVLSGFLITTLLLREYAWRGDVALGAFYRRRARRLLPALLAVLAAVALIGGTVAPDTAAGLRRDIPAALLYASNWGQILTGQSYFEATGRPPLLQHLWSLGIEEQFYLLWPAIVLLALRLGGPRALLAVAVGLCGLVTGWMTWLANAHGDPVDAEPTRVYFGTDTHSMGLFTGAAFAVAGFLRPATGATRSLPARSLGILAVLAVLASAWLTPENSEPLYRGGYAVFAFVAAVLIVSVTCHDEPIGVIAEQPLLRWIGERSYGLYLWHWPVFQLLRPGLDVPLAPVPTFLLRLCATVLVTEACYQLIEKPWRTRRTSPAASTLRRWLPATGGFAALVGAAFLLYQAPGRPSLVPLDVLAAIQGTPLEGRSPESVPGRVDTPALRLDPARPVTGIEPATGRRAADDPRAANAGADLKEGGTMTAPDLAAGPLLTGTQAMAFGDSVLLGARPQLQKTIGGLQVDAAIGRQADALLKRLQAQHAQDPLALPVILHLGTNGFVAERQLRAMLAELHDSPRVLLVNAHAPRRWVEPNNAILARVAAEFPNVTLIDWHAVADGHAEYFVSDDIHLTSQGLRAFSAAIQDAGHFLPPARYAPPAGAVESEDSNLAATAGKEERRSVGEASGGGGGPSVPVAPLAASPLAPSGLPGVTGRPTESSPVTRPAAPVDAPTAPTPLPWVPAPAPAPGTYTQTAWYPSSPAFGHRPGRQAGYYRRVPGRGTHHGAEPRAYRRVSGPARSSEVTVVPTAEAGRPPSEPLGTATPRLVRLWKPTALPGYWDQMAECETGGRWQRVARYGGGLGIYIGTWRTYGGTDFAPTPDRATREEQIIVANRIATYGWSRRDGTEVKAVGFHAWGCQRTIGSPPLLHYVPSSVLQQRYSWGQHDDTVQDLQLLLEVPVTQHYDVATWSAHQHYLRTHEQDLTLAPAQTKAPPPPVRRRPSHAS